MISSLGKTRHFTKGEDNRDGLGISTGSHYWEGKGPDVVRTIPAAFLAREPWLLVGEEHAGQLGAHC